MKTAVLKLTQCGLSEYEAKAYIALLRENPASAYEIAKNSGIPTSKIYEVINKLESRSMIQPIHGERSRRLFIPLSPDEFIQNFKELMEENLEVVKAELKTLRTGMDRSYTWHIKNYETFILRAKRMIDTAKGELLLLIWRPEMESLLDALKNAESRGVKIAVVHYGSTGIKLNQLYRHPMEDTLYTQRGVRGFVLIADSKEVLIGRIDKNDTEAIWSMNEGLTLIIEDYLRHDIYFMKIAERFDPLLREKFGERYEKLRNVYKDEEIK
jgi:sugar-specific transcriptional regulator TrmB